VISVPGSAKAPGIPPAGAFRLIKDVQMRSGQMGWRS
jgi:hypothetical protein